MPQAGGEAEPDRPWSPSRVTGPAIAAALTIAALLAAAGVVAQVAGFSGSSFGDRVLLATIYSIAAMVVLAAVIGVAAVHLVVRGRQIVADRETEREIEALDLLS